MSHSVKATLLLSFYKYNKCGQSEGGWQVELSHCKAAVVEIVGAFHTHPLASTSALGRDQKPKLCGELNTALPWLDAQWEWRSVA